MFSFGKEVYSYWQSLTRLIYPSGCAVCKDPLLLYERHLCSACSLKIKTSNEPKCIRCARFLPPFGPAKSVCSNCASERPFYYRGFALIKYEAEIKTMFHEIKFQKKPWLIKLFSKLLDEFVSEALLENYDLIVPVPLDWRKRLERGFNQAELIAGMLKNSTPGKKIEISNVLKKKKKTLPQSQLRRENRLQNLDGVFKISNPERIKGKRILLVDDIFTTGSTVNECAKILRAHGAERVDFFTVARSQ